MVNVMQMSKRVNERDAGNGANVEMRVRRLGDADVEMRRCGIESIT